MYETYSDLLLKQRYGVANAGTEIERRNASMIELPLTGINQERMLLNLSEELVQKLAYLDMLYSKIGETAKAKDSVILDAYHSATIEGARTTVAMVKKSFDNPSGKSERMVVNTVKGSHYAYHHKITTSNIRTLWEIVVDGVCENADHAGEKYRSGMVYVESADRVIHTPALPEQIEAMMDQLFGFMYDENGWNAILKAFILHEYFAYIHPFCDGNGRTARILMNSYLNGCGYTKIKHIAVSRSINENLAWYYKSLQQSEIVYEKNAKCSTAWMDVTPFIWYMAECFERSLLDELRNKKELNEKQKLLLSKLNKRGRGAEIIVKKASGILKVSESTARKVLNELCEMNYLDREKIGNKYIYKLK